MTTTSLIRSAAVAGLLAVAVTACGGGSSKTSTSAGKGAAPSAGSGQIEVKDFAFKPATATVKVGTKVTWTFKDDSDHNVEPVDSSSELKKSPDLKSGGTYSFTPTKPGMVSYRCGIHNYMTGTINVTA